MHYDNIFCCFRRFSTRSMTVMTIYRKDSAQPEPTKWMLKAFVYGVMSVFLSFIVSIPTSMMLGWDIDKQTYSSF